MILVINRKYIRRILFVLLLFSAAAVIISKEVSLDNSITVMSRDVPKHTLVIDAGHGGLDGGAVASGCIESEINLAIARKLQFIAEFCGQMTVMTRCSEEIIYPEEAKTIHEKKIWDQNTRISLIEQTPNAILVSIHQNFYPNPLPNGVQVLYAVGEDSKLFGEMAHQMLSSVLVPGNRRVAAPISDKIFLMRSINCPAILVECGFLSNPDEAIRLSENGYQTKIALVLTAAYLQFIQN